MGCWLMVEVWYFFSFWDLFDGGIESLFGCVDEFCLLWSLCVLYVMWLGWVFGMVFEKVLMCMCVSFEIVMFEFGGYVFYFGI